MAEVAKNFFTENPEEKGEDFRFEPDDFKDLRTFEVELARAGKVSANELLKFNKYIKKEIEEFDKLEDPRDILATSIFYYDYLTDNAVSREHKIDIYPRLLNTIQGHENNPEDFEDYEWIERDNEEAVKMAIEVINSYQDDVALSSRYFVMLAHAASPQYLKERLSGKGSVADLIKATKTYEILVKLASPTNEQELEREMAQKLLNPDDSVQVLMNLYNKEQWNENLEYDVESYIAKDIPSTSEPVTIEKTTVINKDNPKTWWSIHRLGDQAITTLEKLIEFDLVSPHTEIYRKKGETLVAEKLKHLPVFAGKRIDARTMEVIEFPTEIAEDVLKKVKAYRLGQIPRRDVLEYLDDALIEYALTLSPEKQEQIVNGNFKAYLSTLHSNEGLQMVAEKLRP